MYRSRASPTLLLANGLKVEVKFKFECDDCRDRQLSKG